MGCLVSKAASWFDKLLNNGMLERLIRTGSPQVRKHQKCTYNNWLTCALSLLCLALRKTIAFDFPSWNVHKWTQHPHEASICGLLSQPRGHGIERPRRQHSIICLGETERTKLLFCRENSTEIESLEFVIQLLFS